MLNNQAIIVVISIILLVIIITFYYYYRNKNKIESFQNDVTGTFTNNSCGLNGMEYIINVGNSTKNKKIIKLPQENITVYPNPINKQSSHRTDTFSTTVKNNKLIVQRLDSKGGWGQNLKLRGCGTYDTYHKLNSNNNQSKMDNFLYHMENNNFNSIKYNIEINKLNTLDSLLKQKKKFKSIINNYNEDETKREQYKKMLTKINRNIIKLENSYPNYNLFNYTNTDNTQNNIMNHISKCNKNNISNCYTLEKTKKQDRFIIAEISLDVPSDRYSDTQTLNQIYLTFNKNQASSIYYVKNYNNNKNMKIGKNKINNLTCYFNHLKNKIDGITLVVGNDGLKLNNIHIILKTIDNYILFDKFFIMNNQEWIKNETYNLDFNETISLLYQKKYNNIYHPIKHKQHNNLIKIHKCNTKYNGYYTYTISPKGKTKIGNKNIYVKYYFPINQNIYNTIQNITGDKVKPHKIQGAVKGGYDKYTFILNPKELFNLNFTYYSSVKLDEYQFDFYFNDNKNNKIILKPYHEEYLKNKKMYKYHFKLNPDYQKCGL